jgi:hypothetical protein
MSPLTTPQGDSRIQVTPKRVDRLALTSSPLPWPLPRKRPRTPPRTPGTTRRRKFPSTNRLQGIKPANLSFTQIKEKLVEKLKLTFPPDEWQLHLISRMRQRYDSVFSGSTTILLQYCTVLTVKMCCNTPCNESVCVLYARLKVRGHASHSLLSRTLFAICHWSQPTLRSLRRYVTPSKIVFYAPI